MSHENVELAHRVYEAWNAGDVEWVLNHMAEDCAIRPLSRYPDLEPIYRGKDGFARFAQDWSNAWEKLTLDVMRVEDLGADRLMALLAHRGRGRTSGVDVTEEVGHLVQLRDGLIVDVQVIDGWEATLEAAGLSA
jgi:ketosteroid isomerase-like protein